MSPTMVSSGAPGPRARTLRVATRRSVLAMAQSRAIGERLAQVTGRRLELVEITTRGDVDQAPLTQIGGTGVFVTAVRQALVDGRADIAVHSLKDLPTAPDPRLILAAVPRREDPRDVLVARAGATIATLPAGARVGTGSPRRRAQIAAARPDLDLVEIRGNVDSRIARVHGAGQDRPTHGDLDGVVLAAAGLSRLGRATDVSEYLDPDLVVPAPGQGALAVEAAAGCDASDPDLLAALHSIDDPDTRAAVTAERSVLATLEAGCSAPIGVLAQVEGTGAERTLHVRAVLATRDGTLLRRSDSGPLDQARQTGSRLARDLLADQDVTASAAAVPTAAGSLRPEPRRTNPATKSPAIQDRAIHRGDPNR